MDGLHVKAYIGERYKKYIEACYQTDVIPLQKGSNFYNFLMPYLELTSTSEEEDVDSMIEQEIIDSGQEPTEELKAEKRLNITKGTVTIELPLNRKKVYNHKGQKVYVCNTLYRNRLSLQGQKAVKKFFEREFKKQFRTYMDGWIENEMGKMSKEQVYVKMKEGVAAFFLQYHIDFTAQDISAFARDWYRHRDKVEENKRSPFL